MKKLFVITFKRPALEIEKMTMNIDMAYDCEATGIPQVNEIRLRDARNKYEDVETFECEDSDYIDFVSNDDAYVHFTKTGEHTMKAISESVEADVDSHTENINLQLKMKRDIDTSSFDYNVDIDDVGQIVFTPSNIDVSFVDVDRDNSVMRSYDNIENNIRTFNVSLSANMISDTGNFEWFYDIDNIGQVILTPEDDTTSFLSASIDNSLNLVTESTKNINEKLDPDSTEFKLRVEECLENIDSLQDALESAITAAQEIENDFRTLGCHSADIDGYLIRYLQNYIEDREGEVSCAEFRRRIDELTSDSEIEESLNKSSLNQMDSLERHNIITKFMQGDIQIVNGEGTPSEKYIHLDELDSTDTKTKYEYYYDPESGCIVTYCISGEVE